MFMILCAILQIWGNTSIYTPETFLMMRSWQGKSVFVNFIVPAVFLLFLRIYRGERGMDIRSRHYYWCMLLCVNLASGLCSSMAIVLAAMLTGLCGLFYRGCGQKMAYSAEIGSVLYSDCGVCGCLFPFKISFYRVTIN